MNDLISTISGSYINDAALSNDINNNSKLRFLDLFCFLFFLHIVIPPAGDVLTRFGVQWARHAFKIPNICTLALCVIFFISENKKGKKFFIESSLFLLFLIPSIVIGLYENGLNQSMLSHLYIAIMPFFAMPLGYDLARKYGNNLSIRMGKAVMSSFVFLFVVILFYFFLYNIGIVKRLGFSAPIVMISPFFIIYKRYTLFIVSIILTILTGKRIAILLIFLQVFICFAPVLRSPTIKQVFSFFSFFVVLIAIIIGINAFSPDIFDRFGSIERINFSNADSIGVATSGRSNEILSLIDHLNRDKEKWILGGGIGEIYDYVNPLNNTTELRHLSHLSFLAYTLIFGFLFSFLLYIDLFIIFIKNLFALGDNFIFVIFCMYLLSSFFGAAMCVDPFFWIFLGSVKFFAKKSIRSCPIRHGCVCGDGA